MHEFEEIQEEVLTRLETLTGFATLAAWCGKVDINVMAQVATWPCCYVAPVGLDVEVRNRVDVARLELACVFGQRSFFGLYAAALGNSSRTGLLGLVKGARDLLHRWKPLSNSGWGVLVLEREEPLGSLHDEGVSFYQARYVMQTVQ